MRRTTLVPAYGRDYPTAKAARNAFLAGRDFIIADHFDPWDGKPANLASYLDTDIDQVNIRYRGLTKITVIDLQELRELRRERGD